VLNPQPLEQLWDPAAEGTFGHEVLERTFTGLEQQHVGACTRAALPRYLDAMHAALDEVEKELRPPDAGVAFTAFVHGLRIRLEHRLAEEAGRGPKFTPTRFEQRFKDDAVVPGVVLTGTCDRIDLSPDGRFVCVLDYKRSGRVLDKKGEVYLQIPLYALMAAREMHAEPGGGAYLGVNKKDIDLRARDDASPYAEFGKKWLESPEAWQTRLSDAVDLAGKTVEKMRSGELAPPPDDPCPPYCLHKLVWR